VQNQPIIIIVMIMSSFAGLVTVRLAGSSLGNIMASHLRSAWPFPER